ncbi:MAG: asparagine--tRNA ligase [Candidatus Bathyarchaeota archaeon]|nr:asparagine--tRNA ligase [Candidatus Bathyarchaeota archaeon]
MFSASHIRDLTPEKDGSLISVTGWVYTKRVHGGVVFVTLRDSTGLIQTTTHSDSVSREDFEKAKNVTRESSVTVKGRVQADSRAPGGVEIQSTSFDVISLAAKDYPIKPGVGKKLLLDNRHLHIRSPKVSAILSIRAVFCDVARRWFEQNGFTEVHCPILITAACEGGATLFPVEYFGRKAFLSQSVQLYQEAAITSLQKVFSIEPSFRAEMSRTRRHLTEFWQIEAEVANATLEDIIRVQEQLLSHICKVISEKCSDRLKELGKRFKAPTPPFPKITYSDAIERLQNLGVKIKWGEDLGADEERALSKEFKLPFFVMYYPKKCKAFYHKPKPDDPKVTLSADLLAPEGYGEIAGGGQRIDDCEELVQNIKEFGLNPNDYEWYIDLRKYGSVAHSGFGLGIERTLQWILKLSHIRECCLFPRTPARVYP